MKKIFVFKEFPEIKIYEENIVEAKKRLIELAKYMYKNEGIKNE